MKLSGWGLALLTTLALFAPAATAGTEAAPEVTDPAGDGSVCIQSPACTPNQDFLDLTKAWIVDASPTAFEVHLELSAAPPTFGPSVGAPLPVFGCQGFGSSLYYEVDFQALDKAGSQIVTDDPAGIGTKLNDFVAATVACDTTTSMSPTGVEFDHGIIVSGATGNSLETLGSVDGQIVGNMITWTVPRNLAEIGLPAGADATGFSLGSIAANSATLLQQVGTIFADQAPNSGFGTPFVFGGGSAAKPIYVSVTTPAFSLVAKTPAKSNQTYVYNWTNAQTDVDVTFGAVAKTGSAHVVVKDSANATVLDKTFPAAANGTFELPSAKAGKWQVTVAYANFTGEVGLAIAKHEAGSTVTPTPTSTAGPGGATSTSASASASASGSTGPTSGSAAAGGASSTTKGSPGVGLLLLLAGLGAAVVAVRRRL